MNFELSAAIAILERTPTIVDAWLRDLPEEWVYATEGEETWSAFDMLGHFLHGEKTDWIPRMRIILEHGAAHPFTPYDRFAQFDASQGRSTGELLDEFATRRAANVEALRAMELRPADLARTGTHPEFGSITAEQLLSAWVVHDLGHLRQMARVMAKRYTEDIGPWRTYLPVVNE